MQEGLRSPLFNLLGIDPPGVYAGIIRYAAMRNCLADADICIAIRDIFPDDSYSGFVGRAKRLVYDVLPLSKIRGAVM